MCEFQKSPWPASIVNNIVDGDFCNSSKVRFRRKLAALEDAYDEGLIDEDTLQERATALIAFTRAADAASWRFRQAVLQDVR